jgi:hypothetical protein
VIIARAEKRDRRHLVTPRGVSAGLAVLGIGWQPVPFEQSLLTTEEGLYAWVDGIGARGATGAMVLADDLLGRPVLYKGIGQGQLGVRERLEREHYWIGPASEHGHGIAMRARLASVVVGMVEPVDVDLAWLGEHINGTRVEAVLEWVLAVRQSPRTLLEAAERIAIRRGIYLGDTAAPVQSQFTGAWDVDGLHDLAAFGAAKYLECTEQLATA